MIRTCHPLIEPYAGWPVILDSNLLLLHWCASFAPLMVGTFKRLNAFHPEDIFVLTETLSLLGELRTTPHVLTEVSNLANALPSWKKFAWSRHISSGITLIPELYEPATTIAQSADWAELGLTDAALSSLAEENVILTVDWRLASTLNARGLPGINFKHLRPGGIFS